MVWIRTNCGFEYVRNKFPNVNDAKIREGISIGSQIREMMQGKQFNEDLNETEKNAWLPFKRICRNFLENHKAANYQHIVQDLLTSYRELWDAIRV
jgi:L-fucose isomerase-like protein